MSPIFSKYGNGIDNLKRFTVHTPVFLGIKKFRGSIDKSLRAGYPNHAVEAYHNEDDLRIEKI